MGYDIHITRRKHWSDDGDDISSDEWLNLLNADSELHLKTENGPFFAAWTGFSNLDHAWLDWSDGQIFTKNPDEALIDKMIVIALLLDAKVQGDDGEIYSDGIRHPHVEKISTIQLLSQSLKSFLSGLFSQQKSPSSPFQVNDRVTNTAGEFGTVLFIDSQANHGYGEIRVRFDDGRDLTYMLFTHNLSKIEDQKPSVTA